MKNFNNEIPLEVKEKFKRQKEIFKKDPPLRYKKDYVYLSVLNDDTNKSSIIQIKPKDFYKYEYIKTDYGYGKEYEEKYCNIVSVRKKQLNNDKLELKYYRWGFECSDINNLKTNEQKDEIYNKILNQFQEQLKDWIYE